MTDERAIEILDPEHREHYESIEPVEEACRIGIKAIKRVKELEAENAALRERLEKAVELPVNVEDIVYCIRNCGTGGYRIGEYTVIEIVFKYDNQMRIKTSYGLFGCEEWTFGLDCFADRSEAEARLKEIKGE